MTMETIKGIRVLTPAQGLYLTNGETYSTKVYLGKHAGAEDWFEVDSIPEPEDEIPPEEALAELVEVLQ